MNGKEIVTEIGAAIGEVARLGSQHEDVLTVAIGAVLLTAVAIMMKRADKKTGRPDRVLRKVLAVAILVFSAEGMWEVATEDLNLAKALAVIVFAVGDVAIICEIIAAEKSPQGSIEQRKHIKAVWWISGLMGFIVAWSWDTPVEFPLRFALPILAAGMWKLGLKKIGDDAKVERDENALTWTIVPKIRRFIIDRGWAYGGKQDTGTAERQHLVDRARRIRFDLLNATEAKKVKKASKLRSELHKLALVADDSVLEDARIAVERALHAEENTRPLDRAEFDRVKVAEERSAEAETTAALAAGEAETLRRQVAEITTAVEELTRRVDTKETARASWESQAAQWQREFEESRERVERLRQRMAEVVRERDEALAATAAATAEAAALKAATTARATAAATSSAAPGATPSATSRATSAATLADKVIADGDAGPGARDTLLKLARAYLKKPGSTNADLAKDADVELGTAKRYLPKLRSAATPGAPADATPDAAAPDPIPEPKEPVMSGANGHAIQ